jgi:hypothetical protein
MSRVLRPLLIPALCVLALLSASAPARAQYPKLALYAMVYQDGWPLWSSPGVMDPAAFAQFARYDELIIEPMPFTPYHPEGLEELRRLNPDITLLAYVTAHLVWYAAAADSEVDLPTRAWRTVRDRDGFLYNTQGQLFGTVSGNFANVNLAKRDAGGHYVMAEAMAALYHDAVVAAGGWDGLFLDTFCDDVSWMNAPTESIDVARAGYADIAAFSLAWRAGTDTMAARLRALSGPSTLLVGNCAKGTKYAWLNGWMRENFPYQNGGTWFANMYNEPGGYLVDDARFLAPQHAFMFSFAGGTDTPYTADNQRKVRFGLASASFGKGFHCFGPYDRKTHGQAFHTWWYDEYGVDLGTGRSSADPAHTGWLGLPTSAPYQMIWSSAGPDAVSNGGFETDVTSGWSFVTALGSSLARDASTAAVGGASAHVTIPAADPVSPWNTSMISSGTISLATGNSCSATFWARASAPRTLRVAAGRVSGGGEYVSRTIDLTTAWQRYQVVLTPSQSGAATLQFHLAAASGDVWLDDVHFQNGVNSIYRRDFQNGIVLVNPSTVAQSVVLERPFRRLLGNLDTAANDGVEAATVVVPALDARFLLGNDTVPPADVRDLHAVPPAASGTRQP